MVDFAGPVTYSLTVLDILWGSRRILHHSDNCWRALVAVFLATGQVLTYSLVVNCGDISLTEPVTKLEFVSEKDLTPLAVTSKGYNFVIGRFVTPFAVQLLAARIRPSSPLITC